MTPKVGQKGLYTPYKKGVEIPFTVYRVEGPYCWCVYHYENGVYKDSMFIWKFKDGYNNMHTWPEKIESLNA